MEFDIEGRPEQQPDRTVVDWAGRGQGTHGNTVHVRDHARAIVGAGDVMELTVGVQSRHVTGEHREDIVVDPIVQRSRPASARPHRA